MSNARRWIASAALAVLAGAEAWIAYGWSGRPTATLLSAGFAAGLAVIAAGVFRRHMWARWLALGAGTAAVLNFAALTWAYPLSSTPLATVLFFFVPAVLILLSLGGRRMTEHFTLHLRPTSIWHRADTRTALLGAAIVTNIAAMAMLLVFGALVPAFATEMAIAVVGVAAAVGLTAAERVAGVLLLGATSIGTAVIAMGLAEAATAPAFTHFSYVLRSSAIISFPAVALAATASAFAFAIFAKPITRFLRAPG